MRIAAAAALLLALAPRAPSLSLSPPTLLFESPVGSVNPAGKIVTLRNEGNGQLKWGASSDVGWLSATPSSGQLRANESQDVLVLASVSGLAAGDHSGSVTFHDPDASNSPRSTAVTLRLSVAPVIGTDPGSLSFSAPFGGPDPASQPLVIRNDGGGALAWSLTDDAPWLSATPTSGSIGAGGSATVQVAASASGLASGTHTGTISIDGIGATNGPKAVGVSIDVSAQPVIALTPSSLSFSAPFGGPNPAAKTIEIKNSGGGTLDWTASPGASWLSASPSSGSLAAGATKSVSLSVDVAGLADGVHGTTLTVEAAGASNSPRTAAVTLTVNEEPRIGLNPAGLTIRVVAGGSGTSRAVSLTNGGAGTLNWSADAVAAWLAVDPGSGSLGAASSEPLTLRVDPAGLAEGSYASKVRVESSDASNSPQEVAVTLQVVAPSPSEDRRAGYACGLLGAELLLLVPLLRRRRRLE